MLPGIAPKRKPFSTTAGFLDEGIISPLEVLTGVHAVLVWRLLVRRKAGYPVGGVGRYEWRRQF